MSLPLPRGISRLTVRTSFAGACVFTLRRVSALAAGNAPVPNPGDTAWMLTSSALVLMMSIPGLALFYGGLVRSKNMASILTQVFTIVALVGVLWTLYGYSLAFGDGGSLDAFYRRPRQGLPAGRRSRRDRGDLHARPCHSGTRLFRVPDDLRDDHAGLDHRRLRRAHEVLGGVRVHHGMGDVDLFPDRPLGLGGRRSERDRRRGDGTRGGDDGRSQEAGAGQDRRGDEFRRLARRRSRAVDEGRRRARLRRRHGGAYQRRHRRSRRRADGRQAHRLWQGSAAAAFARPCR